MLEKNKEQKEKMEKEGRELKEACQRLWSTADGIKVARAMMIESGIYNLNKNKIDEQRGKEYMYLMFVKGTLNTKQVCEIEV